MHVVNDRSGQLHSRFSNKKIKQFLSVYIYLKFVKREKLNADFILY